MQIIILSIYPIQKKVILELYKNNLIATKETREEVLNPSLETNLIYLKSNFRKLESRKLVMFGMLLSESTYNYING